MGSTDLQYADLLIIDDIVPSDFSPFRTLEYGHYLSFFDAALLSLEGWNVWVANEGFAEHRDRMPVSAEVRDRILPFTGNASIVCRLAYVTFLSNAIRLLPFLESRKIPFVFQLYPGGAFEVNQPATDDKLRRVLLSEQCRKVIVTQTLTRDYIVDKIGVDQAKLEFIFGGVFECRLDFDFHRDKEFYPAGKKTLDLCFVAHKYDNNLTSKGYVQFVDIARELARTDPRLRFHVVGDYRAEDLPLGDLADRLTFYGRRESAFFARFYLKMDIIISVNQPFVLTPGSFDGFPTGACIEAGFRGVLNCINDPLNLNPEFVHNRDIVLLDYDQRRSVSLIRALLEKPDDLYRLAYQNWRAFRAVFDTDRQLWARTRLIAAELTRHEGLVAPPGAPLSALDEAANPGIRLLQSSYDDLLAFHRQVQKAYVALEAGYKQLEEHYRSLETAYRKLEQDYLDLERRG